MQMSGAMSSSSTTSSLMVPEVLRNNNYKIWSACMENYLSSQGLWELVDGTMAEDTTSDDWKKKNAMALHAIKISCGPKILSQIGLAIRASDAWKQLKRIQTKREKGTSESLHIWTDIEPQEEDNNYKQLLLDVQDGELSKVKGFVDGNEQAVRELITGSKGTLLHAAILAQQVEIVKYLVPIMSRKEMEIEDDNMFSALDTIAAQIGDGDKALQMADCITKKYPGLVTHGEVLTPILLASAHGHKNLTRHFFKTIVDAKKQADDQAHEAQDSPQLQVQVTRQEEDNTKIMDSLDPEKGRLHGTILLSQCINGKMFDVAFELLNHFEELAGKQCGSFDPIQDLCKVPSAFSSGSRGFSSLCSGRLLRVLKYLGFRVNFEDQNMIRSEAKRFLKSICRKLANFDEEKLEETSVREAMLEAAKNGIVEFIIEMARANQRLMWFFDDDRRNIFSYAIIYRQEKVFNLIHRLGRKAIDELSNIEDSYDNNMLHLAAGMPETSSSTSGAALQMQRELQWFKEVEKLCRRSRPSCKEMLNQDGLTPRQLFTRSHKELVKEGENWMKAAAQSATVVVALIVTVTFAAIFTVPGGNNQNTGDPIFLSDLAFKIFIVCNALSFFSSLTSVLMFLGILTSRYAEDDFLVILPNKLIFGLTTLSISIASMMGTFCCALTIMLHGRLLIILPVALLSFIPVAFFFFSSLYPLLYEIFVSTHGRSIFDTSTKSSKKKED